MLGLVGLQHQLNPHSTLEKIVFLVDNAFTHTHKLTAVVSFSALAILVTLRKLKVICKRWWFIYRLPEVFLVVVISTSKRDQYLSDHSFYADHLSVLSDEFDWDSDGIDILGDVPINTGGHFVQFPVHRHTLRYLRRTTSTAVLISVIGFLDSIVSAKQNAAKYGYSISPNRELVALGAGNIAGSFIPGTLPAYGSITRFVSEYFAGHTSCMLRNVLALVSTGTSAPAPKWLRSSLQLSSCWPYFSCYHGYTTCQNVSWLPCTFHTTPLSVLQLIPLLVSAWSSSVYLRRPHTTSNISGSKPFKILSP